MLTWRASGLTTAIVEAWYGNEGTGLIDLFVRSGSDWVFVGNQDHNPVDPLTRTIEPRPTLVNYRFRTFGMSQAGQGTPFYMKISQSGLVIAADDGTGVPKNGAKPYNYVKFMPDAAHNAPSFFYFNVSYA